MQGNAEESIAAVAVKMAPPVSVVAATVAGITLEEWVYILTIIWSILGIVHHVIWKWVIPLRERKEFRARMQLPGDDPK